MHIITRKSLLRAPVASTLVSKRQISTAFALPRSLEAPSWQGAATTRNCRSNCAWNLHWCCSHMQYQVICSMAIGISCLSSQYFGILWFGCPARQNSHANKKQFCAPDAMNSVGVISPSPLSKNLSHRRIQVEIWSTWPETLGTEQTLRWPSEACVLTRRRRRDWLHPGLHPHAHFLKEHRTMLG